VERYAGIRRAVMVDGLSRREAAKRFGVHRNTISKMLQFSVPPGYRRRERPASKKLGPYMVWIDKVLDDDKCVHAKQRHTAHRIFERLRDEEGFSGGYTIVRQYVARATRRRILARRTATSAARRSGSSIFAWICPTRMAAL
jgi:transposase